MQTAPLTQEGQTTPRDIFARLQPTDGGSLLSDNETTHAGAGDPHSFGRVMTLVAPCYALVESASGLTLLLLPVAELSLTECQLTPNMEQLRDKKMRRLNAISHCFRKWEFATDVSLSGNIEYDTFTITPTKFIKLDSRLVRLPAQ